MRAIRLLLAAILLAAAAIAGWFWYFATQPARLPQVPFEFTVRTGAGLKTVSRQLADAGVFHDPHSFWLLARALGRTPAIQAGTYRLDKPLTPLEILDKLARGDVALIELRFIEGTTLRQWMAVLAQETRVRPLLAGKSPAEVAAAIGIKDTPAEGWLFPSTYRFAPGISDLEVLRHAHATMKKRLDEAWQARAPDLPLATPYQALILASIVEKETGIPAERPQIASVFVNRLKRGMRLQTDPTVIYGMGQSYDGNIRKRDLTTDTPWNTYTRDGLPPTPIAMPGAGSLAAVSQPAQTDLLYFVGKGDGTHHFSRTLEEHNRAVARYQLKR
jgi:UPF0755 protein